MSLIGTALLDVSMLIALLDSHHEGYERAQVWMARHQPRWATCALTQNGYVRIVSQRSYANSVSVPEARERLLGAVQNPHHEFWMCDISILDQAAFDTPILRAPGQVTDAYLLALAVARQGRLVTLDRSIPLAAVRGATQDHLVVL